jgi:hypothetical protein
MKNKNRAVRSIMDVGFSVLRFAAEPGIAIEGQAGRPPQCTSN